jgi:hypothetical protein
MVDTDGLFTALGEVHNALDAHNVANIVLAELQILRLVHLVLPSVELDAAGAVLQIKEGHLAHGALAHEATCHSDGLTHQSIKLLLDLRSVMGYIKFGQHKGIFPGFTQFGQLFVANSHQLGHLGLSLGILFVSHVPTSFL